MKIIDGPSLISFFVFSPEIHLMSHDLSLFLERGGLGKTTLSPSKDDTLKARGGGGQSRERQCHSICPLLEVIVKVI